MASLRRLQREAQKNPADPAANYRFGVGCLRQGNAEAGLQALQVALTLQPKDPAVCVALGKAFVAINALELAEQAYRLAIHRQPHAPEARFLLGRLLLMRNQPTAAANQLRAALDDGGDTDVRHLLIVALERSGDTAGVLNELEALLKILPNNLEALRRRAQILQSSGRHREAVSNWRDIAGLTGGDLESRTSLAISLSKANMHKEAIDIFMEITVSPIANKGEALANLGMAYRAAGQPAKAIKALLESIEVAPNSAQANCDLGVVLHDSGEYDAAIRALKKAVELSPQWATAHFNLGLALKAAGHTTAARTTLQQAAALAPGDEEVQAALQATFLETTRNPSQEMAGPHPSIITGNLHNIQLPDVLEFLRVQRMTGSLHVETEEGAGTIHLFDGALTTAQAPSLATLKDVLVDGRFASAGQLELMQQMAGSEAMQTPQTLVTTLVEETEVDVDRLRRVVKTHAVKSLAEMCSWKVGRFMFQPPADELDPAMGQPMKFDLQFLILETMQLMDESSSNRGLISGLTL